MTADPVSTPVSAGPRLLTVAEYLEIGEIEPGYDGARGGAVWRVAEPDGPDTTGRCAR